MRSPWSVRVLLPAAVALSEGSWLAVLYAAVQAAAGELAHLGPLELGALVMAGTAWSRRRRRSPATDAIGLPLLAMLAGAFGWLLDPHVRAAVVEGDLVAALGLHVPGWLAALAMWRGAAHRSSEDDALIEHRLMQWAVPALAIPWLFGYAAASGQAENDFAAAAFVGTLFFIGSTFTALGLARHEALRLSTGNDWPGDRSWLFLIVGTALVLTVLTLPVAALLGIPAHSLLAMMVGPLQTLILIVVLVTAPIFFAAALVADLLRSALPADFQLGQLSIPSLNFERPKETSDLALMILGAIVLAAFLFDFLIFGVMIWLASRDRRRRNDLPEPAFEERAIVLPPPPPVATSPTPVARPHRAAADDATGAYLAALDALAMDGRWPRRDHETPAAHLQRARTEGLGGSAFGRLTAAYQLARYSPRPLPGREQRRAGSRLRALLDLLKHGQRS
jgi:hypothetical protein